MRIWGKKGIWISSKAKKTLDQLNANEIKNIAIIRHGALGDMVISRAFVVEVKKAFPNAIITFSVVSNYTRGIPEDLVDRVHIIHGSDQKKTSFRKKISRIKELGEQDIIFDCISSNRSTLTCIFNKAKLKIGFPYRRLQARLYYDIATQRSDTRYEAEDMMGMLNVLGIKTSWPHDHQLPGVAVSRDRPYIMYFAGAAIPERCWPEKYYGEIIREMADRYPGYDHLFLEGIKEWERGDSIKAITGHMDNVDFIKADSVEEATSWLKGATLLLTHDTGIRHLAVVCETPTVCIYPLGAQPFRYWAKYNNNDIVLPDDVWPTPVEKVRDCFIRTLEKIQANQYSS